MTRSRLSRCCGPVQSRRAQARRALGWTLAALLLAGMVGCAVSKVPGTPVVDGNGQGHLEIRAANYAFVPNVIRTPSKKPLGLSLVNPMSMRHNFTIETADGRLLLTKNLAPRSRTTLEFTPPVAGRYFIYCGRLGHRALGMSGEIHAF